MDKLDAYKIDLKGMQTEVGTYTLLADDDYFTAVQGPEIQHGNVTVELTVRPTSGAFELDFHLQGSVQVICDRCLEEMTQPIDADCSLRVKLGEEYLDEGDDLITIPFEDGVVDLSWHVYEMIALQIPIRHVHPDGQCSEQMQEALEELWAGEEVQSEEETTATDPRWDELKKLL